MQQVAAQRTDLAALPFSATSTAKALETGIDGQSQRSANGAFDNLYQDARAQNTQRNEKTASASYTPRASEPSNTYGASVRAGKDRDAGHTSLPDDEKISDIPPTKDARPNGEPQTPDTRDIQERDAQNQKAGSGPDGSDANDGQSQTYQKLNEQVSNDGDVEQGDVTETVYVVGDGGEKDANAGVIITPGTPDGKVAESDANEQDVTEPDWVAFVERIANRHANQSAGSDASQRLAVDGESTVAGEVREIGKLWKLPDDVDTDSVDSVLSHLLSQLQGKSGEQVEITGESTELLADDLSEDAINTLRALVDLLNGKSAESASDEGSIVAGMADGLQDGKASALFSDENLASLINQLLSKDDRQPHLASTDTEPTLTQSESDGASSLTAEEAFVLSILKQALDGEESAISEDVLEDSVGLSPQVSEAAKLASDKGSLTQNTQVSSTDGTSDKANMALQGEGQQKQTNELLAAIAKLPAEGAQKATEAFADRIVATMPNGAQQQTVKNNIIAGINEFQQQVQQGREPGIDLAAIVEDAAKEAAVSSDVAASLSARVDGQASQFLQLMNNTQSSVQQVLQAQVAQVDNVIDENNQFRSEASKTQQQFEGFDKAVNIHKPEGQQQLNEKIRWMVNARNTMAEIRLDPPELGSMQVRVNVAGDAASVSFVVQSQQAKDALADAMPKLRDMLQEQGIELGDAQVRKDNSSGENGQQLANSQGNGQSSQGNRGNNDAADNDIDDTRVIEQSVTRELKGGIDFYA